MTHMPNYSADRLAPYTFESLIGLLQCGTNLELKTVRPVELSKIYFDMFPEEKMPIWCQCYKNFFVTNEETEKAKKNVHGKRLQHCLIFVGKASSMP